MVKVISVTVAWYSLLQYSQYQHGVSDQRANVYITSKPYEYLHHKQTLCPEPQMDHDSQTESLAWFRG